MIIENPDSFKSWLTSILEPLCDADPAALAKYVYALVKKDKPLGELRDGMLDQLDVFLQHETKPFVEMLFKSLETQEYLSHVPPADSKPEDKQPSPPHPEEGDMVQDIPPPPPLHGHGMISSQTQEYLSHVPPADSKPEDKQPSPPHPEEGDMVQDIPPPPPLHGHGMISSHTQENLSHVPPADSKPEDKQPSPPHPEEGDMVQDIPPPPPLHGHGMISSQTQEYLSHVPPADSKPEDKQPSPPHPEEGDMVQDIPPPPPLHGHVTNGKPADRVDPPRSPPAPRHRVVVRNNNNNGNNKQPLNAPKPRPLIEQTLVKASQPLTELLEEPVDQPPRRRDRRDFMREADRRRRRSRSWERRVRRGRPHRDIDGERNPDRRRPISRSPSPRGRYRNRSPPPGDRAPSRSRSRSPTGGVGRERERDRLLRVRECERDRASRDRDHRDREERSRDRSRDRSLSPIDRADHPESYNKRRCRDFDEKGYCMRGDLCQWDHGADPVVLEDAALTRVLLPPHPPEYNPLTPDIWSGAGGFPPYPPPLHAPPLPRELIPIPRIRHEVPPGVGVGMNVGAPLMPLPTRLPPPNKNFDYNRLGPVRPPPLPANAANCSLEVKKVPRGLNDITHLNNHFSKFGKIVNIQVCYGGDPEGALITFSSPAEANVAYKSTEAVLNNRFIKVFWHNPENKQENTAPNTQQNKPLERAANQHPLSHNKVLVNRVQPTQAVEAACIAAKELKQQQQAAELKSKEAALEAKKENSAQPSIKPATGTRVMEMHKRAQALLETQLHQQLLLIQRLESGNVSGAARAALLEAINSAQEGIEKLRAELVAYNKALRQASQQKKPKTREEAQKEILDAELDMFTKQQEGQDVTELAKKIADLRRQMSTQFPAHAPQRRMHRGGRFGSTRLVRNGPSSGKVFNNQVVDHRPRALLVSGFEPEELDTLLEHLSQYGEITGKEVNLAVPELTVQYSARAQAEQAALRARHYNDRTLSITWVANNKPIGGAASTPTSSTAPTPTQGTVATSTPTPTPASVTPEESNEPEASSASDLLRFEEEEEDEQEDRSWRR